MISDAYVIKATTMPTPAASAMPSLMPASARNPASRVPRVAPEKAPDRTPTSVMPIWTVDRKRPGSAASLRARAAPLTPLSRMVLSRAGRADTMASSDIASRPLVTISAATMMISTESMGPV